MSIINTRRAGALSLLGGALVAGWLMGASVAQASPTTQAAGTKVAITPAQGSAVTCGDTVPQEVRITNVQGLYGVDVRVTYDPSILEVVDSNAASPGIQIQPGNFPDVTNGQGMVQVNNVDTAQGTISYAAIRLNPAVPQDGSGVIATITFKAKANGNSPINLAWVMLSDKNARPITAELTNGAITVSGCQAGTAVPPSATPVPGQKTPTPVPGHPTATTVPGQPCYHTVKPGETLSSIARMYGTTVEALMRANGLTNPNLIYVGQKLLIPNCGGSGGVTPVPPPPTPVPGTCFAYIVKPGDTLSSIAARTGDTVYGLARRNGIVNPNLIFVGQRLTVCPGGSSGGYPPPPPPPPRCRFNHVVVPGDTVFRLALRYGSTVYAISAANGLTNPNWIYVGQTLCIP